MWQAMDTKVGEKARTVPESVLPCPVQILPDRQKQPRHSESDWGGELRSREAWGTIQ